MQFSTHPCYGIPDNYLEQFDKKNKSQFDRDCERVMGGFRSKFRADVGQNRDFYLSTFSLEKWLALPLAEKNNHTLSNCVGCYEKHKEQQHFFPLKPFYEPKPVVVLDQRALQRQGPENFTSNAVTELKSLLKVKSIGLERKKNAKERRKERRDMQKEITKKVNELRMLQSPC